MSFRWLRRLLGLDEHSELIYLNGHAVRVPADHPAQFHPDGVPVGMKPGDPLEPSQLAAIFTYVESQGITRRISFSYRSPEPPEEQRPSTAIDYRAAMHRSAAGQIYADSFMRDEPDSLEEGDDVAERP